MEEKEMKKYSQIVLIIFIMFILITCAGQTQKTTLTSYEMTGITLEEFHKTAEGLCDAKKISAKDCNDMVAIYAKARNTFQLAGDAIVLAGKATDSVVQKRYIDISTEFMNDVLVLIEQIKNLIDKSK